MKEKEQARKKTKATVKPAKSDASGDIDIKKSTTHKKHKNKKNTSLRLDKSTLKALKIKAIEHETSIQNLIESLIHEYLKKDT